MVTKSLFQKIAVSFILKSFIHIFHEHIHIKCSCQWICFLNQYSIGNTPYKNEIVFFGLYLTSAADNVFGYFRTNTSDLRKIHEGKNNHLCFRSEISVYLNKNPIPDFLLVQLSSVRLLLNE